jgi:predicted N-formylglutamate amidohydrolase
MSDGTAIPGNVGLSESDRAARIDEIFTPYHERIKVELAARRQRSAPTLLISLHSFTPVMGDAARPWRFGVLHRNDSEFSRAVLEALRRDWGDEVGDNQPYAMEEIDFTIPYHAAAFGLDYLEIEVRQDLIADNAGQETIGRALEAAFRAALDRCG